MTIEAKRETAQISIAEIKGGENIKKGAMIVPNAAEKLKNIIPETCPLVYQLTGHW